MTRLLTADREEEEEAVEEVEAAEERRLMGAGVGARLRMESDLRRLEAEGCACALLSGWNRVEVSKWTGMLKVEWGLLGKREDVSSLGKEPEIFRLMLFVCLVVW